MVACVSVGILNSQDISHHTQTYIYTLAPFLLAPSFSISF